MHRTCRLGFEQLRDNQLVTFLWPGEKGPRARRLANGALSHGLRDNVSEVTKDPSVHISCAFVHL